MTIVWIGWERVTEKPYRTSKAPPTPSFPRLRGAVARLRQGGSGKRGSWQRCQLDAAASRQRPPPLRSCRERVEVEVLRAKRTHQLDPASVYHVDEGGEELRFGLRELTNGPDQLEQRNLWCHGIPSDPFGDAHPVPSCVWSSQSWRLTPPGSRGSRECSWRWPMPRP